MPTAPTSPAAARPRCEILAIGSEMTSGIRLDTNSRWLAARLVRLAVKVGRLQVVPDTAAEIAAAYREGVGRACLVVSTGGLGPTEDDRSFRALAQALGRELVQHAGTHRRLAQAARERGQTPAPGLLRQAMVPAGAQVFPNPRGTAPGVLLQADGSVVVALPGVPDEMMALYDRFVAGELLARFGPSTTVRRVVRAGGLREAEVESLAAWRAGAGELERTILVGDGSVDVYFSGPTDAVDEAARRLARSLGADGISTDGSLCEEVVLEQARRLGGGIAVAESCTGGRIAARLTAIPGASDVFMGGMVVYSDAWKTDLLGVPPATLETYGAVSRETVEAMARGLCERTGCRWALTVTGIAGPAGGRGDCPVGTVWLAVRDPGGVSSHRVRLGGGRQRVQAVAAGIGLDLLRRRMAGGRP
ncbi:MAG: nicotinamide-nucleotide amidohydrolase family protein [Acidobacteriota bacterium]